MTVYLAGDSHAEGLAPFIPGVVGDWSRGRQVRQQPPLPKEPSVVIVSLGTNDYLRPELSSEVEELARSRGGRPLIWLLPLHATRPDIAERRAGVVARILKGLRNVRGVKVVDPPVVELPDGVHATRNGYRQIAEQLLAAINQDFDALATAIIGGAVLIGAVYVLYRANRR